MKNHSLEIPQEAYFSWSKCELGESKECHLGGNRYDITFLDKDNDEIELSVCEDCYLKLFT